MRKATVLVIALMAIGCGSKPPAPATVAPAPADPWTITNNDPKAETPALLWNGLIGIRFGHGQARLFDISAYDKEGEEKIRPLPAALDFEITSGGNDISLLNAKEFSETLDMRTGEVVQTYTADLGNPWRVEIRTAIHPTRKVYAQKLTIQPRTDAELNISNNVIGDKLESNGIVQQVTDKVTNLYEGKWSSIETRPTWSGKVDSDPPFILERVVSLDKQPALSYEEVAEASEKEWAKRWQTDIEIDGPVEDQQAVRSFLFYLRSAIHPDGKMSISPMGLSNDIYSGHVFWDADIWVFPALALIEPDKAKAIPEYRLAKQRQATINFNEWVKADRPTASGKIGFLPIEGAPPFGCKFPWESSVSGKETVPGPSKFEDHITGSVAFSVAQAGSLGLAPSNNVVFQSDQFYRTRAVLNQKQFEIKDVVSPDENHTGDNDLYTNLVAQWCETSGSWDQAKKPAKTFWAPYKLPKDDKTFLTYDNDPVRGYKQAAAVLSIYPLQYPPAEAQAKAMMERFAEKVTKNGPAMTDSIHAIVWARLGEAEKAYAEWRESWQPFMRPPFLLFSEKRNSSRTYFTTGAAGSLQAVLYGFAGLRIDDRKAPGARWSMPLKDGKILSIAPHLPKAWKKLTLKNLAILGKRYTFEIANDKVTVNSTKI